MLSCFAFPPVFSSNLMSLNTVLPMMGFVTYWREYPRLKHLHSHFNQETGVTILMLAVKENRLVLVERLLDLGASVNHQAEV